MRSPRIAMGSETWRRNGTDKRPGKDTKSDGNWPIEIVDLPESTYILYPIINGNFPVRKL
jgi:hypothetical protein